jgi:hypothetical protein
MCLLAALISSLCMCGSGGSAGASTQAGDPLNSGTQTGSSGGSSASTGSSSAATGSSGSMAGSSGSSAGASSGAPSPTPAGIPSSDHVFVIMLENQDFSQVFPAGGATSCSSSGMPNLCVLAAANGVASHFYANTHGSLLSYLFNTSGADWKGKPWDCTGSACASAGVIKGDNIVRALNNAHKTWRGYFEGMPICGCMGGSSGNYTAHHNPFKWYSDVADSTNDQQGNMCPFTQLAVDLGQMLFRTLAISFPISAMMPRELDLRAPARCCPRRTNGSRRTSVRVPGHCSHRHPFSPVGMESSSSPSMKPG